LYYDISCVLGLNAERTEVANCRINRTHLSENPPQIVKWMTERQKDAAAQILAGAVAHSVILPGMPARKVLPPMDANACDVAYSFLMDQGPYGSKAWMKTVLKADHHPQVFLSGDISKLGQTVLSVRHRLLDKEMAIRLSGCERYWHMMTGWIANKGRVRSLSQGVVEISIALYAIHFFDVVVGWSRFGESCLQAALSISDNMSIVAQNSAKIAQMALADRSETHD
jgi:hypothetical protein